MTEDQNSDETTASNPRAVLAESLGRTLVKWHEACRTANHTPDAAEQRIIASLAWLMSICNEGRDLQPFEREILARIDEAAGHPSDMDRRIQLGSEIVAEHARRYQNALAGGRLEAQPDGRPQWVRGPEYRGNSPNAVVHQLVVQLFGAVHRDFGVLETKVRAVATLLDDYKGDRGRRTKDGAGSGKMSAQRILAELNQLAGNPLGKKGMDSIKGHLDRAKGKHIPKLGT